VARQFLYLGVVPLLRRDIGLRDLSGSGQRLCPFSLSICRLLVGSARLRSCTGISLLANRTGRKQLADIAKEVEGKTEEEVKEYAKVG
jgi:hypothetical protein